MKTQSKLEKILNGVKEIRKQSWNSAKKFLKDNYQAIALGTIWAVAGAGEAYALSGGEAKGGTLRVYNYSPTQPGISTLLKHIVGATERYDMGVDAEWFNNVNELQIYSNNLDSNPSKLSIDAKDSNSTTTYSLNLFNNGFSGTANNLLKFKFNGGDSEHFEWKNIFLGDANDSNNIVADIKFLIKNGSGGYGDFNLPDVNGTQTGVYDKRKIMFLNCADLNRDGKVNNQDYTIFAGNWGRTGVNVGSDINALRDYADIDRTGSVNYTDLVLFVGEWLWDADDPNTW